MKKKGKLWYFESYQEIRDYLAQGLTRMEHYIYLTTHQRAWIGYDGEVWADTNPQGEPYVLTDEDKAYEYHHVERVVSREYSIRAYICGIEDMPVEDYAVKKPWQVVELEAPTVVEGFYKAGEHLAEHIHTVGQKKTSFTTTELTKKKDGVVLENDSEDVEYLYRIKTQTGFYQCHQDALWKAIVGVEVVDKVSPAKRRMFTIKEKDAEERDVILRMQFTVDNEVQRMKQGLSTDELRPVMCHPAIETATGVMVVSDGLILIVHKLKNYEQDAQGALPAWAKHPVHPAWAKGMLSVPKEVCQMKGMVTVEVTEGKWEELWTKGDGTKELIEKDGIIITATDEKGRQGVLKAARGFTYPNWRSVIPNKIGPAISIDPKKLTDGVKRIATQLDAVKEKVTITASAGDKVLELSGSDEYFNTGGSVKVDVGKVPCDMLVGLKAPMVIVSMGFNVKTMHYKASDQAVLSIGDDTFTMQMPMLVEGKADGPTPPDDKLKQFDIEKWLGAAKAETKTKSEKLKNKKEKNCQLSTVNSQQSLTDRLRAALRKQLGVAA